MNGTVARPTFYEGEILPAADLTASVDYARDQMARHARQAHSWGIVAGLDLSSSSATTAGGVNYAVVTVNAGVAIDGTGREIIVPANVQLDPTEFMSQVNPQPDASILYPVFLTGLDQAAAASSGLNGACDSSQSTQMQETYSISFGSPGGELSIADQTPPGVTDGPDDGSTSAWNILLGFVTWSASNFTGAADFNPASGIGRRYIGVSAAEVVSQSGSLLLATHPASFKGQNSIMAVEIQEAANDGQLVFGKLDPDGTVVPVLTVKSNGEVVATGQISGAVTPGSMQVQSGIAFDGMTLPLPLGIDPADVDAGRVTLHIHVSTRMDQPQTSSLISLPYECFADNNTRLVHCRIQQFTVAPAGLGGAVSLGTVMPSYCDYMVIAAVAAS
jgi:hypothetical protein